MPIRQRHIQGLTWKYILLLLLTKVIEHADRRLTCVCLLVDMEHLAVFSTKLCFGGFSRIEADSSGNQKTWR